MERNNLNLIRKKLQHPLKRQKHRSHHPETHKIQKLLRNQVSRCPDASRTC